MNYKIPESVLVVIHTPALEVLLLERAGQPGFWQSVTGSLDRFGEPPREAAIREVAEETGLKIGADWIDNEWLRDWHQTNDYEIFPIWRHRYEPGVTINREHVFGLMLPHQNVPIELSPREHLRFEWLPAREAAARCFSPSNTAAIEQLISQSIL